MKFIKTEKQIIATQFICEHDECLMFGSARSGKTLIALYTLIIRACKAPNTTHIVVRKYSNSLRRSIWAQTLNDVMKLAFNDLHKICKYNETQMTLTLPNNSKIMFLGCDNRNSMDKILGIECSTLFIDEISELYREQFDLLKSRLAERSILKNRLIATCNPTTKTSWVYKYFVDTNKALQINVVDNLDNVSKTFIETLKSLSDKQKKRFLLGEWANEIEGALWDIDLIEKTRKPLLIKPHRTVIGVDPATTSKLNSDLTGLIVSCKVDEEFFVLEDDSGKYTPQQLAVRVDTLFQKYDVDTVVIETNQGGDYVLDNLKKQNQYMPVKGVHHRVGKVVRAESISYLFERNLCHLIKSMPELEDEMVSYVIDSNNSPDRLDAMVIGIRELNNTKQFDLHFGDEFVQKQEDDWKNF